MTLVTETVPSPTPSVSTTKPIVETGKTTPVQVSTPYITKVTETVPSPTPSVTRTIGRTTTVLTGTTTPTHTTISSTTYSRFLSTVPETTAPPCVEGPDPNNTCIYYTCQKNIPVIHETTCTKKENCSESEKIWDKHHCCYSCPTLGKSCKPIAYNKTVEIDACKQVDIELTKCQGYCPGLAEYDIKTGSIKHMCKCCQEEDFEEREIQLDCNDQLGVFKYIYIKSCECKECEAEK
ncbi:apomucin-like [Hemitrygon akajei]|uniref:apomucin-like n=1 Tax=Hemitrygon akajei TaxID=2704970 RepID=UPI003BFA35AD